MSEYTPMTPYEWLAVRLEGRLNLRTFNASVGKSCKLCGKDFQADEKSMLFPLEPEDQEEIEKQRAGEPYIAPAVEVHFSHFVALVRDYLPSVYAEALHRS